MSLTAKIQNLNKIMKKMPPKVIYGAWNGNGQVHIQPNLLNKNVEFVHDDSEDDCVELKLCEESARLVESFKTSE